MQEHVFEEWLLTSISIHLASLFAVISLQNEGKIHYDNLLEKQSSPSNPATFCIIISSEPQMRCWTHVSLAAGGNRHPNDLSELALAVPGWAHTRQEADFSDAWRISCFWDLITVKPTHQYVALKVNLFGLAEILYSFHIRPQDTCTSNPLLLLNSQPSFSAHQQVTVVGQLVHLHASRIFLTGIFWASKGIHTSLWTSPMPVYGMSSICSHWQYLKI